MTGSSLVPKLFVTYLGRLAPIVDHFAPSATMLARASVMKPKVRNPKFEIALTLDPDRVTVLFEAQEKAFCSVSDHELRASKLWLSEITKSLASVSAAVNTIYRNERSVLRNAELRCAVLCWRAALSDERLPKAEDALQDLWEPHLQEAFVLLKARFHRTLVDAGVSHDLHRWVCHFADRADKAAAEGDA